MAAARLDDAYANDRRGGSWGSVGLVIVSESTFDIGMAEASATGSSGGRNPPPAPSPPTGEEAVRRSQTPNATVPILALLLSSVSANSSLGGTTVVAALIGRMSDRGCPVLWLPYGLRPFGPRERGRAARSSERHRAPHGAFAA